MNISKYIAKTLVWAALTGTTATVWSQTDEPEPPRIPLSDQVLQKIPSGYREEVEKLHLTATESDQQKLIQSSAIQPDAPLALALKGMSTKIEGFQFMVQRLQEEPSAGRRSMILKYGITPVIRYARDEKQREQLRTLFTHVATEDEDPGVSSDAIDALRRLQWGCLSRLAAARSAKAKASGDLKGSASLLSNADTWLGWDGQMNLPNFMRTPPPTFEVIPTGKSIHVVALGDFGTGSPQQFKVAHVMKQLQEQKPFDFGLTLGDNFYPNGVSSPDDPQWKAKWEDVYNPVGIPFYATLGNHDYMRPDGPAAEVMHTQLSKSWKMPATHYTFTAGPVQFFAIDTIELSDSLLPNIELAWLDAEIAKSHARWKVVYGHYQIYSATRGDERNLIDRLLPLLRNRVDVYLCGHDHNLQELKPEDGVHFFVSGGGGAGVYPFRQPNYSHSTFKQEQYGLTVLDANEDQIEMRFVDLDGKTLYTSTIHK
jgi:tartrate-resistant acid phosphatase type 5